MTEIEKDFEIEMRAICANEPLAFDWFYSMVDAVMTWDHIIDDDPVDKERADKAFRSLILGWPINSWFLKYREILVPIMSNCLSSWRFSNEEDAKIKSYDFMTEIPCAIAFILGGQSLVDRHIPNIRRLAFKRFKEDELEDGGKK